MPLDGTSILWDESSPAGSEKVGLGDDRIRSTKTSVRAALDSEHYFASSSSTAGAHRPGSAVAFYGATSAVSSLSTTTFPVSNNGRMMIDSTTTRLYSVGYGGASMLGAGPLGLSVDSAAYIGGIPFGSKQTLRWGMEVGIVASKASTHRVTFPNSGFSAPPYLQISCYTQDIGGNDPARIVKLDAVSASEFSCQVVAAENGDASTAGIMWYAIGPRAL